MKQLEITRDLCRFLNDVLHETEEHVTSIVFGISEAAMSIRASFKNVSLLNLEKRADSEYESLKKGGVKEFIVIAFKAGVKHRITYVINDGGGKDKSVFEENDNAQDGMLLRAEIGEENSRRLIDTKSFIKEIGPLLHPMFNPEMPIDLYLNGESLKNAIFWQE